MTPLEIIRWAAFGLLVWYVPGVVSAWFLRERVRLSAPVYLAVCWIASPVIFSAAAVPLSLLGIAPVYVALSIALVSAVLGWRREVWTVWWSELRRVPLMFAIPVLLGASLWAMPDSPDMRSDTYAHVSAVKSSVEESLLFPVRGFHGDEISRGADPRFGTLHAFYGVACSLSGTEPIVAWQLFRGLGLMVIVAGGLALICTMSSSAGGISVGLLALLASSGGGYYNILTSAAYPLWFSLGVSWTLIAMVFGMLPFQKRPMALVAGLGLAALVGMHFFAFMLGGFLLAGVWIAARSGERLTYFNLLLLAAGVALPNVIIRFATSYSSANPIHHKIWQCMEWSPGLYSASPVFVTQWLFPFGAGALIWSIFRYTQMRDDARFRWLMVCAVLALTWISVPWFLSPSMKVLGFLPLRLMMAVGTPFLLALLSEQQTAGRRFIVAALLVVLGPAAILRAQSALPSGQDDPAHDRNWSAMLDALTANTGERVVLLSDPFSMLVAQSMRQIDIVAVPDGRSSPRDPLAIDRLRDAWRAMSSSTGGRTTNGVLHRYGVTHILVNPDLPPGLVSYEYPIQIGGTRRRLQKFQANMNRVSQIWSGEGLTLFEVNQGADLDWDESYLDPCGIPVSSSLTTTSIGSGYGLQDPVVEVVNVDGRAELRVQGTLTWTGIGAPPDRQLVLRLDREPFTIPQSLQLIAKPTRKIKELFGASIERYRWTTYPGGGRCPTWVAGEEGAIALDLRMILPTGIEPARYSVNLAARDRSVFEPLRPSDFFLNDDSFQGPTLGVVQLP